MGGKVLAKAVGDGADVDVHLAGDRAFSRLAGLVGIAVEVGLGELFGGADGELAADDLVLLFTDGLFEVVWARSRPA